MDGPPLDHLSALLDLLRSRGVRVYRETEHGIDVEFEPTTIEHPDAKPAPDPDRCACGHMAHEHGDGGLCLHGCDPSSCSPPEEAPK
jgi:hypothetical protein